ATSAANAWTSAPPARSSSAAASARAWQREQIAATAPWRVSSRTTALPKPRLAASTTARYPVRPMSIRRPPPARAATPRGRSPRRRPSGSARGPRPCPSRCGPPAPRRASRGVRGPSGGPHRLERQPHPGDRGLELLDRPRVEPGAGRPDVVGREDSAPLVDVLAERQADLRLELVAQQRAVAVEHLRRLGVVARGVVTPDLEQHLGVGEA